MSCVTDTEAYTVSYPVVLFVTALVTALLFVAYVLPHVRGKDWEAVAEDMVVLIGVVGLALLVLTVLSVGLTGWVWIGACAWLTVLIGAAHTARRIRQARR